MKNTKNELTQQLLDAQDRLHKLLYEKENIQKINPAKVGVDAAEAVSQSVSGKNKQIAELVTQINKLKQANPDKAAVEKIDNFWTRNYSTATKTMDELADSHKMNAGGLIDESVETRSPEMAANGKLMGYNAEQLGKGIRTEFEHTPDANVALEIATDHLNELPKYYTKLEKVEGHKLANGGCSNAQLKTKGGFVQGEEDEYAGDKIPAQLNKGELVLNAQHQQIVKDLANGDSPKIAQKDRADNMLNKKEISLNRPAQEQLFKFLKGETPNPPKEDILVEAKHLADGGDTQLPPTNEQAAQAVNAPEPMPMPSDAAVDKIQKDQNVIQPQEQMAAGKESVPALEAPVQSAVPASQVEIPIEQTPEFKKAATQEQLANQQAMAADATKNAIISQDQAQKVAVAKDNFDIKLNAAVDKQIKDWDANVRPVKAKSLTDYFADENKSLPEKLLTGVALVLSTVASFKTGSNPMLNYISGAIDKDLDAQKLNQEQYLAKKKYYLELVQQEISKQSAKYNNKEANARADLAITQIDQIKQNLQMQQTAMAQNKAIQDALGKATSQGSGLSRQTLEALPKEYKERAVILPNGNAGLAYSKERAEKLTEIQNQTVPAIQGAKRILELSNDFNRVTDLTTRGQIATELKSLGGQLRLPFTGPGVLTEKEYDRLMDILGDPRKLAAFPSIQKAKLETVINKLQSDLKTQYKNAGVEIPMTQNEKNIEILKKNNKGLTDYQAEQALKTTGKWLEE